MKEVATASKAILIGGGARRVLPLVLALALVLGWVATAQAQTSANAQYESPTETASGNPAVSGNASKTEAESKATEVKSGGAAAKSQAPKGEGQAPKAKGEAKASGSGAKTGEKKELPNTGGMSSVSLLALGAGALLVGGVLLTRRITR